MNEAKLREYAELIVKIGANVQKGQRVRLQTGGNSFPCQNFLLVHRKAPAYSYFMVCKKAALCKKQPFSYQLF